MDFPVKIQKAFRPDSRPLPVRKGVVEATSLNDLLEGVVANVKQTCGI